jgi:hypothetical protein
MVSLRISKYPYSDLSGVEFGHRLAFKTALASTTCHGAKCA